MRIVKRSDVHYVECQAPVDTPYREPAAPVYPAQSVKHTPTTTPAGRYQRGRKGHGDLRFLDAPHYTQSRRCGERAHLYEGCF